MQEKFTLEGIITKIEHHASHDKNVIDGNKYADKYDKNDKTPKYNHHSTKITIMNGDDESSCKDVYFPLQFKDQEIDNFVGKPCRIEIMHSSRDENTKFATYPRRYSIELSGEHSNKGLIQCIVYDTFQISEAFY